MQIFAAALSSMDRLRQIPVEFWLRLSIGFVAIFVIVFVVRKIAQTNKVMLSVGVFLALTIIGFNWIYERNEPKWASPAVHWLAEFFPSKGVARGV